MATSKNNESKSDVRRSIKIFMIRHAESQNNEVYRNARYIYRGGTPDFDLAGWTHYIDTHRSADPGLSEIGKEQAEHLADFMVPYLEAHASTPVQIISSPMRRTLETIRPTYQRLRRAQQGKDSTAANVLVNAFYFESEGCHTKDIPEPGMSPPEIRSLLCQDYATDDNGASSSCSEEDSNSQFVGFPGPEKGWYADETAPETRAESEQRAAKFYLWLVEHLDPQLEDSVDVFDAGVHHELEEDASSGGQGDTQSTTTTLRKPRHKRRTALLAGHGDFMSLVLKRIVAGFGHAVENEGIPHRSAFVHVNTGITELEYFGKGRFLIMSHNQTPHFTPNEYDRLRTGGSLKDGWSYLMPNDEFLLDAEVSVAFLDELEDHVVEQATALKALYLSSDASAQLQADDGLSVEEEEDAGNKQRHIKHFIVKHGLQVVAVASYSELTGRLTDVAVRPSAGTQASETLVDAVKQYSKKFGRSGSLLITPRSGVSKAQFEALGFEELGDDRSPDTLQLTH
jgi:phosphohistidine phosphatase SixA